MGLRWVNAVLGLWIFASAFVAGERAASFGDHIVVGLAVFVVAFVAMGYPRARYLNAALGAWLVLSPFVFHYLARPIAVNDLAIGILVVSIALTASRSERHPRLAA